MGRFMSGLCIPNINATIKTGSEKLRNANIPAIIAFLFEIPLLSRMKGKNSSDNRLMVIKPNKRARTKTTKIT